MPPSLPNTNHHNDNAQQQQNTSSWMIPSDMTRRMACGAVAGMVAKTITNPLDRIRMLSQTGEHAVHNKTSSTIDIYRSILQREGVWGLWAGNGANLLRVVPAKAVVFSTNDYFRQWLSALLQTDELPAGWSFVAGGLSGLCASAVTYPLDLARGRIAGKMASNTNMNVPRKHYTGIVQTLFTTIQDEGFRAIYRGITPTLAGAIPYEGIKFGTVGILESLLSEYDYPNTPWRKLLFGACGGIMAGLITYPNDTVRRLLQLQGSRGTKQVYRGYWDCVVVTYRQDGLARFYRGVGINLVRMAPNVAIQFGTYEWLKQWTADLGQVLGRPAALVFCRVLEDSGVPRNEEMELTNENSANWRH